ncbi:hypothetical protein R84B8_00541 [Treponema sp. R8-4-B8]
MNILKVLKRHTENSFESINMLFNAFSEDDFEKTVNGFPIWQQIYHMINSIDRIFIDPENYVYPEFHKENINNLDYHFDKSYTKECLYNYFQVVKNKIYYYLDYLNEDILLNKSNHKTFNMTKLDHILAQFRHMGFHLGYLHSCAKVLHGNTPVHILI